VRSEARAERGGQQTERGRKTDGPLRVSCTDSVSLQVRRNLACKAASASVLGSVRASVRRPSRGLPSCSGNQCQSFRLAADLLTSFFISALGGTSVQEPESP